MVVFIPLIEIHYSSHFFRNIRVMIEKLHRMIYYELIKDISGVHSSALYDLEFIPINLHPSF